MAVDSKHPEYGRALPDWEIMRDSHKGERHVKEQLWKYLPATAGMVADGLENGKIGRHAYDAYITRARFPDIVRDAIRALLGVMHNKPAVIELPAKLESMLQRATIKGESLQMLLARINEEQLITGRVGLLLDVQDGAAVGTPPYVAVYTAETIINWDDGRRDDQTVQRLNMVILNESEFERDRDFEWTFEQKHRVAVLDEGVYKVGVFRDDGVTFSTSSLTVPSIAGRTLPEIPFVFINTQDVVPEPDQPPLLGLANLSMTIYRGEADYRQALFMQGQDTLVVIGESDADRVFRTGANASITLPMGADAKFIGVGSEGLAEMRAALENDRKEAETKSGQLLDSTSRSRESGDALRIRVSARTATLNQLAVTAAFGLEQLLKTAARWVGANENEVVVTPNLDFVDTALDGKTLVDYMTAKKLGAPWSLESIHAQMRKNELTEMEFQEELDLIESEAPLGGSPGAGVEDVDSEDSEEPDPDDA